MARNKDKLVQVEIKGFKSVSTKKPLVLDFCDVTILLGSELSSLWIQNYTVFVG